LGIGLSYGASAIINHLGRGYLNFGMPTEEAIAISIIPSWLALFAVIFAMLVGVVAGLYPAYRAVRLSPIKAIRNE
jgi:putative ABC transport system permease protein